MVTPRMKMKVASLYSPDQGFEISARQKERVNLGPFYDCFMAPSVDDPAPYIMPIASRVILLILGVWEKIPQPSDSLWCHSCLIYTGVRETDKVPHISG